MSKANDLTQSIVDTLNLCGAFAWRNNSTGIYDPVKKIFRKNPKTLKGVSDILGILSPTGRVIAIEVKIGRDKLSPDQKHYIETVNKKGGIAFVVKTYDGFISAMIENLNSDELYLVDKLVQL